MTTRHTEMMDTPEWMRFGIVLRTRTIDFSAESEEDAAPGQGSGGKVNLDNIPSVMTFVLP